jgi:hypothetical protein
MKLKPATSPAGIIFLDLLNRTPIMVARKKAVTGIQTNPYISVSNMSSVLVSDFKKWIIGRLKSVMIVTREVEIVRTAAQSKLGQKGCKIPS